MTKINPATHKGIFAKTSFPSDAETLWWNDLTAAVEKNSGREDIEISNTAPADTTMIWLDPDDANAAEGVYKVWDGAAWVVMTPTLYATYIINKAGASTFTGLSDSPATLTGQGGKMVAVNAAATGLEFVNPPSAGGPVIDGSSVGTYKIAPYGNTNYPCLQCGPGTWAVRGFNAFGNTATNINEPFLFQRVA